MSSQGSPYARFRRALAGGNANLATDAAHELGRLSLLDALALTLVYAQADPERFELAAVRWHARLCRELPGIRIDEAALALAALRGLAGPCRDAGGRALAAVCERNGFEQAARLLDEWLERLS